VHGEVQEVEHLLVAGDSAVGREDQSQGVVDFAVGDGSILGLEAAVARLAVGGVAVGERI
jgi:hypothetical protein